MNIITMPCWYFERREIRNSPSHRDGIDSATENRYRREGARFILDAGTKMGLRIDTCATGKVEETPKKCKDIIKIAQSLISSSSFQRFGEDPREEVMTMERILLKTIKFDLQIEHPYSLLIKYLKYFKGEKDKTQKMAQMAWTFINDSLCTTLCLQWEPEIIAVSLMYLASRLSRFDPSDWSGRTSSKTKWWEDFVEGMSMELMEDICHQVLDLYSKQALKKDLTADSPPPSPAKTSRNQQESPPPPPPPDKAPPGKKSREVTPSEPEREAKIMKKEKDTNQTPSKLSSSNTAAGAPIPVAQHITPQSKSSYSNYSSRDGPTPDFNSYNPYVSNQMYSASFLSQEGSQNIQSILAGSSAPPSAPRHQSHRPPPPVVTEPPRYPPPPQAISEPQYPYHPPPPQAPPYIPPSTIPASHHSYPPPAASTAPHYDPYALPPNPSGYLPSSSYHPPVAQPPPQSSYPPAPLPPQQYNYPSYPQVTHASGHDGPPSFGGPPSIPPSNYPHPSQGFAPHPGHSQPQNMGRSMRPSFEKHGKHQHQRKDIPSLTEIKITGRPEWGLPK